MYKWIDTWWSEFCPVGFSTLLPAVSPQTHKKLTTLEDEMTMSLHGFVLFPEGSVSLFKWGFPSYETLPSGKTKEVCLKSYFPKRQA